MDSPSIAGLTNAGFALNSVPLNLIGKKAVTQKQIATEAGCHHSTVSLALRNDLRLPLATREHVQDVARRLGYEPNPLLSLLMSRVQRGNVNYRGTLGYLHTVPRNSPLLQALVHRNYLAGAKRRASEFGYSLDELYLGPEEIRGSRVAGMLKARGIMGVIVEHLPSEWCPDRRLPVDLSQFATASLGVPLASPLIHYVASDQYMRPILAAREVLALGYRRPGLVLYAAFDSNMAHRCSAGFWSVQAHTEGIACIPNCLLRNDSERDILSNWLEEHRPDVILVSNDRVIRMARTLRWRIPQELGAVCLDRLPVPQHEGIAGVYGNAEYVGMAAVELVVSQLHRGDVGPPARTTSHLISSSWVPGKSVRKVGPRLDLEDAFFSGLLEPFDRGRKPPFQIGDLVRKSSGSLLRR
ncbi:MAG: LacI family DNA-binding transcriptional regulator [Opitutaceae bacterium]|jgi:LacI family transcriptional regulator|nr:LacI family DNA-binding transcriptional regulator [Opitutaceae bacterium]